MELYIHLMTPIVLVILGAILGTLMNIGEKISKIITILENKEKEN